MAAYDIAECAHAPLGSEGKSISSSTPGGVTLTKSRSTFATDVLKLVSGSASAQVLTILTAPFVARLFAPAAFGIAAVFVSITGVISAVVGMRYELSIVLPEKDEDAANAMAVSLSFIILTSALTAVLAALVGDSLLDLLHARELHKYLWLAPIMVFLNGVFASLSYWNTRKKKFGRQTLAQLGAALFFVGAQIGAGLTGHTSGAVIIVATILSILLSTLILGAQTWCECCRLFICNVRLGRMWASVKRYSDFPKYSTASAVLNNLGWQIPTFMLSAFFSTTVVGQYAIGNKALRIPVNLVGANIATVFFQHASETHHQGEIRNSIEKMFRYLIAIFVFPSLLLCLIGKDLFVVVFGSRWAEAGVYTEILSVYVLFWFMAVPLGIALNVLEKQALELRLVVVILLARVGALFIGGTLGSARLTLALFAIAGVLGYGYFCLVVLRSCAVSVSRMTRVMAGNVIKFIPVGLILGTFKYIGVPSVTTLLTSAVLLAIYYAHFIHSDSAGREILSNLLRKLTPLRTNSAA